MIEPRMDHHLNVCRYCDRNVIWATADKDVRFPLDADPAALGEAGTIAVTETKGVLYAAVPTRGQAMGMRTAGVVLYSHHGLTCPRASEWHKVGVHGKATRRAGVRR